MAAHKWGIRGKMNTIPGSFRTGFRDEGERRFRDEAEQSQAGPVTAMELWTQNSISAPTSQYWGIVSVMAMLRQRSAETVINLPASH